MSGTATGYLVEPSTRALRSDEKALYPLECDRIYRKREGWFKSMCESGLCPGKPVKVRGRDSFQIHPDDAFAVWQRSR